MAYPDPKHNVIVESVVADADVATGTATASGANTLASAFPMPKYHRPKTIAFIRVYIKTAPSANFTGVALNFLNGTDTFAVATIGTHTAGEYVDVNTESAGKNAIAADTAVSVTVTGTATASGAAQNFGAYSILFDKYETVS